MDYLVLWVTHNGMWQTSKSVKTIVNMHHPNDKLRVRKFIVLINYFSDMWTRKTHMIHPSTRLS